MRLSVCLSLHCIVNVLFIMYKSTHIKKDHIYSLIYTKENTKCYSWSIKEPFLRLKDWESKLHVMITKMIIFNSLKLWDETPLELCQCTCLFAVFCQGSPGKVTGVCGCEVVLLLLLPWTTQHLAPQIN